MERRQTYLNYIDENFCVKLPFILNEQQIEVLREIDRFVHDPFDRVMTISGWAGTGKTTLMEIVKGRYWSTGPNIHFAATTHKAAAVLKTKVNKKVSTVNSLFGIMIEVDMDNDSFDVSKKKRNYDTEKLQTGSLVIIDEASMLSEENYKDVIKKCTDYNCKVIFIGDSAQLAPVNEDDISIVFRDDGVESKHVIELTKVERTDDVPILDEATRIRLEGHLSYKTNINEQGGVQYITNAEQLNQAIDSYVGGLTNNPNYFRILTYTNKNVESLNTIIRRKLGYGKLPEPGEPLMSYANWKYIGKNTYAFVNSESYKVISIEGEEDVELKDELKNYDGDLKLHVINIKIQDPLGKELTIPYIDIKNNKQSIPAVERVCREKISLWKEYKNTDGKSIEGKIKRQNILCEINRFDDLLFVNENITDAYGNLLQQKVVDFGYAHTIHKSQGSTFDVVLINDIDIENNCHDKMIKKQLRYVGLTRAKKKVMILTNIKND